MIASQLLDSGGGGVLGVSTGFSPGPSTATWAADLTTATGLRLAEATRSPNWDDPGEDEGMGPWEEPGPDMELELVPLRQETMRLSERLEKITRSRQELVDKFRSSREENQAL